MKKIRLLSLALVVCIVASLCVCFGVTAETAEDYLLADLRFSEDNTRGQLQLTGAVIYDEDIVTGAVTIELTSASATVDMIFAENFFAEGGSGTVHAGEAINVNDTAKHPYFAYDYASADGVVVGNCIAHYTRKDKAANSSVADLWLSSMTGNDYTQYQKVVGDGYGVWDWGAYLASKGTSGVFDDGMHRFTDVTCPLVGTVGSRITFYTFGVYYTCDNEILQLGTERPEPTPKEESKDEPKEESKEEKPAYTVVSEKNFFVMGYDVEECDGCGIVYTVADTASGWSSHYAFTPNDDGTFTLTGTSIGIGSGAGVALSVPEGGFVYVLNQGNNWPDLMKDKKGDGASGEWYDDETHLALPNYTSAAVLEAIANANLWKVGNIFEFDGLDLEDKELIDENDVQYYEDSYVCSLKVRLLTPYVEEDSEDESAAESEAESAAESQPETSKTESKEDSKAEQSADTKDNAAGFPVWAIIVIAVAVVAIIVVVVIVVKKKK